MATNITEFSYRCAPDLPGCPVALINQKVVDAIIQLAEDTHIFEYGFEYEISDTDVDESDNNSVTLDLSTISGDPFANKEPYSISLFKIDGVTFRIEWFELSNDITDVENIRYGSNRYYSAPTATTIKIWPMEVQDATLLLSVIFKPILGITTIDDFIFSRYHEAIEAHAKWLLMKQKKKPWSDSAGALEELEIYNEKMGLARIDKNLGQTRQSIMVQSKYIF